MPSRFQASSDAQILSGAYTTRSHRYGEPFDKRVPERILKPRINKQYPSNGIHPTVGIYVGHSRATTQAREYRVAKLVASAFYGLPYDPADQRDIQQWTLRYIDGDVTNCYPVNLEWVRRAVTTDQAPEVREAKQTDYERNRAAWDNIVQKGAASSVLSRLYAEVLSDGEAAA